MKILSCTTVVYCGSSACFWFPPRIVRLQSNKIITFRTRFLRGSTPTSTYILVGPSLSRKTILSKSITINLATLVTGPVGNEPTKAPFTHVQTRLLASFWIRLDKGARDGRRVWRHYEYARSGRKTSNQPLKTTCENGAIVSSRI